MLLNIWLGKGSAHQPSILMINNSGNNYKANFTIGSSNAVETKLKYSIWTGSAVQMLIQRNNIS